MKKYKVDICVTEQYEFSVYAGNQDDALNTAIMTLADMSPRTRTVDVEQIKDVTPHEIGDAQ